MGARLGGKGRPPPSPGAVRVASVSGRSAVGVGSIPVAPVCVLMASAVAASQHSFLSSAGQSVRLLTSRSGV